MVGCLRRLASRVRPLDHRWTPFRWYVDTTVAPNLGSLGVGRGWSRRFRFRTTPAQSSSGADTNGSATDEKRRRVASRGSSVLHCWGCAMVAGGGRGIVRAVHWTQERTTTAISLGSWRTSAWRRRWPVCAASASPWPRQLLKRTSTLGPVLFTGPAPRGGPVQLGRRGEGGLIGGRAH